MPRLLLILLCLLLLASPPLRAQDAEACNAAFPAAESRWQIPKGLLSAIAQVESNRWPWIIDTAGTAHSFASKAEAEAAVASLTAQGLRNVDVGCMQISLLHHPDAFASLSQAFDPAANIDYAARFLAGLHRLSGSWEAAIARYHSATPGLGEAYRRRVLAAWHGDALAASEENGFTVENRFGLHIWRPRSAQPDPARHLIIINSKGVERR